jgi:hypothetical protein
VTVLSRLNPEDLRVTSFETGAAASSWLAAYTPDCCTDDNSGCKTGPETGCPPPDTNAAL